MTKDEIIEQAKEELRDGIERSDEPEAEIMRNVLALLESAKTEHAEPITRMVCGSCGCEKLNFGGILVCGDCYAKLTKAVPVQQDDREFTKGICETLDGSPSDSWLRGRLREACDRLDAQQQEIERLETENRDLRLDTKIIGRAVTKQSDESSEFATWYKEIDYTRRLLSHLRGESVPSECRTCKKSYWYVDDEPIICPHCHPKEALGEQALPQNEGKTENPG